MENLNKLDLNKYDSNKYDLNKYDANKYDLNYDTSNYDAKNYNGAKLNVGGAKPGIQRGHRISLNNRQNGAITGVNAVISFDPNEILLETQQGMLLIKGMELNVTKLSLDKGEVDVSGLVDSFTYSDLKPGMKPNQKGENGLFERLFK